LDPDLTDLADFRTPDECAQALSHYLPADLGQPYIEQCIREGRIPTVGVKFSPIFKPERAKHESIPDKFWIDISQWGIEDLFDCGTVCSSTPTASEKVRSKGQYDLVAGEVTYSDIRLHWPSVERIAGSDKRPATMIRRSVEEPTQTTMKGRPSRTNWDDWWLAVIELAVSGRLPPDSNPAEVLKKIKSRLGSKDLANIDRKLVEEKLHRICGILNGQLPPLSGE
jgi:hypothetical protein